MKITPSQKSPEMETALKNLFGFDRRKIIEQNLCAPKPIGCGGKAETFRDALSRKEYSISGLCQVCQDKIFPGSIQKNEPEEPPVGPNDFQIDKMGMICGQEEAQVRTYRKYPCKNRKGVWLVAIQEASGENVYYHDPDDKNSQGFGGSTLKFPLEDGTVYEAKGPWHGNTESLFEDTGVDIRDKHFTFVVLGKSRDGWPGIIRDVVYKDEKPTLGKFDRYKDLIKLYPEAKVYYSQSSGGSQSGPISDSDR